MKPPIELQSMMNKAAKILSIFLTIVGLLAGAGCAAPSAMQTPAASHEERLMNHVEHLASPGLKGRRTGTRGARLAREYIQTHFRAAGLVPWGESASLEQDFRMGCNVVGVLPGSDPDLAREIVLVSAHYDHEGRKGGKVYPGAADNASGVAVLLELARELSRQRPARTVAFAAFDAEERMMFGSFVFSLRADVTNAPIVAMVNADMLGRCFLDVVTNAVFVSGVDAQPGLRGQLRKHATAEGIRVLPIGSDLVGPRSDHVAFEHRNIPCLFFSCGTFRDYHEPTDTVDQIDPGMLARSAGVIARTVRTLATDPISQAGVRDFADELRTVNTVLAEAAQNAAAAGILSNDVDQFQKLAARAAELQRLGNYGLREREDLAVQACGILAPYLFPFGGGNNGERSLQERRNAISIAQMFQLLYFNHGPELMKFSRDLVDQVITHRPGLFRKMPEFRREICHLDDRDVLWEESEAGSHSLYLLMTAITLEARVARSKWLVNAFSGSLSMSAVGLHGEGSREELADHCLLALREQRDNPVAFRSLRRVYARVAQLPDEGGFDELLEARMRRGNMKDELEWLARCSRSEIPDLVSAAVRAFPRDGGQAVQELVCDVLADVEQRPYVRAEAIRRIEGKKSRGLELLCEALSDDRMAYAPENYEWFGPDYPLRENAMFKAMKPFLQDMLQRSPMARTTISDLALERLQKITGKRYGKDAAQWRAWVERKS